MCCISQLAQRRRTKVYKSLGPIGCAGNYRSDISPNPPLIFTGCHMCENLLSTTQPHIDRFRSNLVQSLVTWHPIYNKLSRSRGQRSMSQRENVGCLIVKLFIPFRKSWSLNLILMSEFWSEAVCAHAQNKIGENSLEQLARRRAASNCNASQLQHFVVLSCSASVFPFRPSCILLVHFFPHLVVKLLVPTTIVEAADCHYYATARHYTSVTAFYIK